MFGRNARSADASLKSGLIVVTYSITIHGRNALIAAISHTATLLLLTMRKSMSCDLATNAYRWSQKMHMMTIYVTNMNTSWNIIAK
ncbi:uncharacterized protein FMAN_15420 [Fusarium mangiferae]|uniref:Uncharacterized protein n=1 Tax=Fusarium mangiferae TaxID=192010 RepID=A0A1L7UMZ6_FUSMA|nr:uncharacterized protein FMAN_15420 [Fusarium mangiferae]CVL09137.1 uncharacterized protein FMAN_15420 [Fusarium mangiferae]